jgi:hypothetical protein
VGGKTRSAASKERSRRWALPAARLDALIEEATVDAHDDSEQTTGFYTILESSLAVPFKTQVLGVEVTVERIDLTEGDEIVAVCSRETFHQRIRIADLPLPDPPPEGWKWIEAYRRWVRSR